MLNEKHPTQAMFDRQAELWTCNRLLASLPPPATERLRPFLEMISAEKGDTLFEPGDDVSHAYFPLGRTVIAFTLPLRDGRAIEAATVGREGVVGGIISLGVKPAFARAVIRIPGDLARVGIQRLEEAKRAEPRLQENLTRYADCLIAQVLQSVACATVHPLEARCSRWLLMMQDRLQAPQLPMTQDALAEMFGVARTYVTRMARGLQRKGAISYRRGVIRIEDRAVLEASACECYGLVRDHFERVLPGIYPTREP
ncbi:Crp/Fnr family transcriptional regulator [Rhizobium sp. SYY.PMSO]|uniref:Crp/Fnr family transcriptional regulator n=1 Tax=Rhizobium sp. SYY.PMSO TaxID=3382192 RepID=UPI000DDAD88C